MGKRKYRLMLLLLFISTTSCFAKQITIQIVQHNFATDKIEEASLIVEDELMDGFFSNGYIVTNAPAVISSSEEQDLSLYNVGVGDAYEDSSDYFVQIKLYFSNEKNNKQVVVNPKAKSKLINIQKIDWTIASAVTGEKIKESSLNNENEEMNAEDLKKISSNLLLEIKKAIKA